MSLTGFTLFYSQFILKIRQSKSTIPQVKYKSFFVARQKFFKTPAIKVEYHLCKSQTYQNFKEINIANKIPRKIGHGKQYIFLI